MKIKLFAILAITMFVSSCAQDEQYVGSDSLIMDDTFLTISLGITSIKNLQRLNLDKQLFLIHL